VLFDDARVTVRLVAAVSTSPIVKGIAPVDVPVLTVLSAMSEIVGASFTAFTVNLNVSVAVFDPSLTVTVIVTARFWFAAGVTVTVRLAPLPPKTMLPFGTRVVLLDVPVSVKFPTGVSASPTVKLIGPMIVSSLVV
jgi:hypothetical protein